MEKLADLLRTAKCEPLMFTICSPVQSLLSASLSDHSPKVSSTSKHMLLLDTLAPLSCFNKADPTHGSPLGTRVCGVNGLHQGTLGGGYLGTRLSLNSCPAEFQSEAPGSGDQA